MLDLRPRYAFWSRWELAARPRDVYAVLSDPVSYPKWWPQFRQVKQVTDIEPIYYYMVVRSFLPYRIAYRLLQEEADPARGLLLGRVEGDISGLIRWDVDPSPSGSVVVFEERVRTNLDLLNLLAPLAKWAFEANHRVMMRDGLLGLRAYLAGQRVHDRDADDDGDDDDGDDDDGDDDDDDYSEEGAPEDVPAPSKNADPAAEQPVPAEAPPPKSRWRLGGRGNK